jgi:hypothetical protein
MQRLPSGRPSKTGIALPEPSERLEATREAATWIFSISQSSESRSSSSEPLSNSPR